MSESGKCGSTRGHNHKSSLLVPMFTRVAESGDAGRGDCDWRIARRLSWRGTAVDEILLDSLKNSGSLYRIGYTDGSRN